MPRLIPFHNTYRATGVDDAQAQDIVLIHGWGLHAIVFDDIVPALLAHFRVTVVDLPGMGQSPLPNDDYSLDFLAEQVLAIMPQKAHLLGWSLGGLVALALAEKAPERVQSVVTVATSPRFTAADDWAPAMKPEILAKFAEMFNEDNEGTLVRFLALNCKGSAAMREDTARLKQILYFCGLPAPRALRGGLNILRDSDLRESLTALSMPVLMVFGEHDHIVPAAVMAAVEPLIGNGRTALIEQVAHVPFLSTPDTFTQAVYDFYRDYQLVR
ncbi:biotin biosynthesis protein bioH [Alcanivorax sp. 97CO-5]|jgi:pimeloyl-[acyl-carrier protein] methyl ester esterase|uniref:pimeloyl-ACP methyl ester esterase BioH n=1 Tax=unclassified Alcanivorax TaxID=2638842 RepID=UPI0003E7FDAB|nr:MULTISPECIES: pimeloyl-ACP methyl ester esterase BioH [unclassified Alcanivorax]EUC68647.1 biotin biosynthesis protein bioH [Alcanivorax sp. 97CO-5]PKG01045.1 pimeloyl-[acyl-carrier protein] methyl ester esterase [Alcanivorax sp. 97CO-6]